jgi:ATP-dependent Lhr-like helicase
MAASAKMREETGVDVETLWGDDGFVIRFPDVDQPPDPRLLLPDPEEVQALVVRQLGSTSLFAAKFRENAARSLLLPKRRAGQRTPLWQQRKRAADLLAVASRYGSFPVLLETYRECLRDFFDMPALVSTLADVRSRKIRVSTVDADTPSPFASALLFTYVASFLYDGDAPLAERRAQALAVDQSQLRDLLGDAELRELLDADSMDATERQLQRLDPQYRAKGADGLHDLLLGVGDLTAEEIVARSATPEVAATIRDLVVARRVVPVRVASEERFAAVEDAARLRDALGVPLPLGLPESLLEPAIDAIGDLARRYARTHAPFPAGDFAARFGLAPVAAEAVLMRLSADGQLIEGEFRPGGTRREWTDANVLRMLRRRSLAKLREEIEPVDHTVLGRFATTWQGIVKRRRGADALLDAIEQLQGAPIPASILETEILPARLEAYDPADLDAVTAAGEVVWVGIESLGERDGRVALYLADHFQRLVPPGTTDALADRERSILDILRARGASFFGAVHEASGGGYPGDLVDALWNLVWKGLVTNDTFHALRAFTRAHVARRKNRRLETATFRSRRLVPSSAEGRWAAVHTKTPTRTTWAAAFTQQLLARHGVLTREAVASESVPGGFGQVYPVLKHLEETGRIRRGYFVEGLGATQFAMPGALDLLRSLRAPSETDRAEVVVMAATDPANPYGATLKFPAFVPADALKGFARSGVSTSARRAPTRTVGATVVLVNGALAAYLARGDRQLTTFLPEAEPDRSHVASAIARVLIDRARTGGDTPRGMLIEEIDGTPPGLHPITPFLQEAGFVAGALGMQATLSVGSRQSGVVDPGHQLKTSMPARSGRSPASSPFGRRFLGDEDF